MPNQEGGLSYICLATRGIPIAHHILRMLAQFSIPLRDKASYMPVTVCMVCRLYYKL